MGEDIYNLKIETLSKEIDEIKEALKELKAKQCKDVDGITERIKEMEAKHTRLEIVMAEIRADIKNSSAKIDGLEASIKEFILEQRELSKKIVELEVGSKTEDVAENKSLVRDIFNGSNKTYLMIIGFLVVVILVMLGVNIGDALKVVGLGG